MVSIESKLVNFKTKIVSEIAMGVWHEDDRIPNERKLSEYHGVSRSTVRLALDQLIKKGLLVRHGKQGTFVSNNATKLADELINNKGAVMSVAWIMEPEEATNPLLQAIFNTCIDYMDRNIRFNVCFDYSTASDNDVMVICSGIAPEQCRMLQKQVKAVLLLNMQDSFCNYLTPDNFGGGRLMAEYALKNGHRKIGCLANSINQPGSDFEQRYLGIKSVFEENGIELETVFLEKFYYIELVASAHFALDMLLRRQPELSLVLCNWDLLAFSVMKSLHLRSLRMPEDISLIGFDDQCYARGMKPGLTTVKYPAEAIGIKLAEFLNTVMQGEIPVLQETMRPILIERNSVINLNNK